MILSLSCLVTLSYSLPHSISCAGFYKFVKKIYLSYLPHLCLLCCCVF